MHLQLTYIFDWCNFLGYLARTFRDIGPITWQMLQDLL